MKLCQFCYRHDAVTQYWRIWIYVYKLNDMSIDYIIFLGLCICLTNHYSKLKIKDSRWSRCYLGLVKFI